MDLTIQKSETPKLLKHPKCTGEYTQKNYSGEWGEIFSV